MKIVIDKELEVNVSIQLSKLCLLLILDVQKHTFAHEDTTIVKQYIMNCVDCSFEGLVNEIKIADDNLQKLIKFVKIPRGKNPQFVTKWLQKQIDGCDIGIDYELTWNVYPHFVMDGMCDLAGTECYKDIANAFQAKLQPLITQRVNQYTQ